MNTYFVTGTHTGFIIQTSSEGVARRKFHEMTGGESITSLSARIDGVKGRKRLQGSFPWENDLEIELSIMDMHRKVKKPLIP